MELKSEVIRLSIQKYPGQWLDIRGQWHTIECQDRDQMVLCWSWSQQHQC